MWIRDREELPDLSPVQPTGKTINSDDVHFSKEYKKKLLFPPSYIHHILNAIGTLTDDLNKVGLNCRQTASNNQATDHHHLLEYITLLFTLSNYTIFPPGESKLLHST